MHAYTPAPAPEQTRGRCSATGYQQRLPHRPGVPAAAGADAGTTPTALLPLNRTVVRDLGVHPRGEFRTSGAAVGQKIHGPRQRPSFSNAEDCLSSEGGRQGLPARRPSVESDGASRAPRGRRRAVSGGYDFCRLLWEPATSVMAPDATLDIAVEAAPTTRSALLPQ